jgi:HEPN domain-containing protein
MTKQNLISQWLEIASSDLAAAKDLHKAGHLLQSVCFCQQALEKCIKAYMVSCNIEPPYIHNLIRLFEAAKLSKQLSESQSQLLNFINPHYIKARYPEYKSTLAKNLTESLVQQKITEAESLIEWINKKIK